MAAVLGSAGISILFFAGGYVLLMKGIRSWRNPAASTYVRLAIYSERESVGFSRATAPLGTFLLWGGLLILLVGLAQMGSLKDVTALKWIMRINVILMMLNLACVLSIVQFNRPKFLVPPHLRGDAGSASDRGQI